MKRFDLALGAMLRGVCNTCLVLLFTILTMSVINRFGAFMSMGWADEIIELLFAWLVFLGAACLWRERSHFRVDMLQQRLAGTESERVLEFVLGLLSIVFLVTLSYQAWDLVVTASDDSPVFALSKKYWYGVMPVASLIMICYTVRDIWIAVFARPNQHQNPPPVNEQTAEKPLT